SPPCPVATMGRPTGAAGGRGLYLRRRGPLTPLATAALTAEDTVTPRQLAAHLTADRPGELRLPDAVRPAPGAPDGLREGYRLDTYRGRAGLRIPALAAAASCERLFDLFLQLLEPLGDVVDVVLETSHASAGDRHRDLRRSHIDAPVLASYLCEHEDLLLNDGCTGVAVIA